MARKRKRKPQWSWRRLEDMDPGLRAAIKAVGSAANLADLLKITPQAIAQWVVIPIDRVLETEKITGIDRAKLRPDVFKWRKAG